MFEIEATAANRARLRGRLDASQEGPARAVLEQLEAPATVDMSELTYISSVGLGVLLALQLRLAEAGKVTLTGVHPHIRELLTLSGIDQFFAIE